MTLHRIAELCTEWFSVRPNIPSTFRTTAILKSFFKQNDCTNKPFRYVHYHLLHQTSFVLSAKVPELSP
jgi:hypothetical protein